MQQEQTKQLLEEIAANTHPDYIENVPQVHIIGSIGAGKSSFLHGIHKYLRMYNAGLQIEQKRATSASQLLIQRNKGIFRANATVEPETLRVYSYSNRKYLPIDFLAEGSHENANKLTYSESKKKPNALIFCLDLSFLEHLHLNRSNNYDLLGDFIFQPSYDIDPPEDAKKFKNDLDYKVYESFINAIKTATLLSEKSIPIIPIATHCQQIKEDSPIYKSIIEKSFQKSIELIQYIEKELNRIVLNKKDMHIMNKIFENPICIDSRSKSLYGIETAAHHIISTATGINPEELKLVSFSHQMDNTDKTIKYNNVKRTI